MHHLNHEFFSSISSENSLRRSSRLNPHCPAGSSLWSGGRRKSTAGDPPCFLLLAQPELEISRWPKVVLTNGNWCIQNWFPRLNIQDSAIFLLEIHQTWPAELLQIFSFEESAAESAQLEFFQLCLQGCYSFQTLPFFHHTTRTVHCHHRPHLGVTAAWHC